MPVESEETTTTTNTAPSTSSAQSSVPTETPTETVKKASPEFVIGRDNTELKVGDKCFAIWHTDKLEYVAQIERITPSGSCNILYLDDCMKKTQKPNTLRKFKNKEEKALRKIVNEKYYGQTEQTNTSLYDVYQEIGAENLGKTRKESKNTTSLKEKASLNKEPAKITKRIQNSNIIFLLSSFLFSF